MRVLIVMALALAGCTTTYQASNECARTAGCVSSLPSSGYGPIQAQAAEPQAPSRWQPQR